MTVSSAASQPLHRVNKNTREQGRLSLPVDSQTQLPSNELFVTAANASRKDWDRGEDRALTGTTGDLSALKP